MRFSIRDSLLRLLPHATPPGLRAIGAPGPDAPVLVTGNYTLTVRRLVSALRGRDVWLLVANSRGINVWCAAGGGHFTAHDVIAAVRAARLGERIDHRLLILPQLAATGIEPHQILEVTGFASRWGPARLEHLPEFLDRGCKVKKSHRVMRFPAWERAEMATMWAIPIAALAALVLAFVAGGRVAAVAAAAIVAALYGVFLALPRVPIVGTAKWLTFGGAAGLATLAGTGALVLTGGAPANAVAALAVTLLATVAILSLDIAGTTPYHPGTINSIGNRFHLELVEERCTGAAECVQVCPRNVLQMDGHRHKVVVARSDDCILCGACIVQCPDDALRFHFEDGRIVEPSVVRTTRLNMLGRRTVAITGK